MTEVYPPEDILSAEEVVRLQAELEQLTIEKSRIVGRIDAIVRRLNRSAAAREQQQAVAEAQYWRDWAARFDNARRSIRGREHH